jgi:hypothetical protein
VREIVVGRWMIQVLDREKKKHTVNSSPGLRPLGPAMMFMADMSKIWKRVVGIPGGCVNTPLELSSQIPGPLPLPAEKRKRRRLKGIFVPRPGEIHRLTQN